MSQPQCGLLPQRLPNDENEVGPPRVMVTSAAAPPAAGLAQFMSGSVIGGHDMRQLMEACLLAFTDAQSVVRSDLHAALIGVGVTASPATHHGYRVRVRAERSPEPFHLLDGMNVSCAPPGIYGLRILQEYRAS
jgi:hypothetical protein